MWEFGVLGGIQGVIKIPFEFWTVPREIGLGSPAGIENPNFIKILCF